VEVDAELIKFEALEASHDDEEDQSLEQELGLIQPPRAPRPDAREREDGDSDADEDSGDEDSEAKGSADEAPAEAVKSEGDES
jgi:hypothetical protein